MLPGCKLKRIKTYLSQWSRLQRIEENREHNEALNLNKQPSENIAQVLPKLYCSQRFA